VSNKDNAIRSGIQIHSKVRWACAPAPIAPLWSGRILHLHTIAAAMPRILIINGPNLNLLGTREPAIYGGLSLEEVLADLRARYPHVTIDHVQSNLEGGLVEAVQGAAGRYDGVVLNAGGYAHTSVALRAAVAAVDLPVVEVHISNLLAREPFRHVSLVGAVCVGGIMGLGTDGYRLAVDHLLHRSG
jgi:3-dehydroquinate dehydratase-2